MDKVVFNFHDVVLLMTAIQCLFFSVGIILTKKSQSDCFLAAFLIVLAFIPIHELILWGSVFKLTVRNNYPSIYFMTGFAYYIDTVLLYFYIKSLTFKKFKIQSRDYKHLIPLSIFLLYLVVFFYARPFDERVAMINDESFAYSSSYVAMDLFCKLIRVFNCVICLIAVNRYKHILESTQSKVEITSISWLKILVVGFFVVTTIELLLSSIKVIALTTDINIIWYEVLGLSGYYALFIIVNILIFTSIRLFSSISQVKQDETVKPFTGDPAIYEQFVEQIKQAMDKEKHFLIPDITLDMLASEINISAKNLSTTLNRKFNMNFYEFINNYRIEEAKLRLIAPHSRKKTITQIYLEVGFNSKSVFNTFFKKSVGLTPSQYRSKANLSTNNA